MRTKNVVYPIMGIRTQCQNTPQWLMSEYGYGRGGGHAFDSGTDSHGLFRRRPLSMSVLNHVPFWEKVNNPYYLPWKPDLPDLDSWFSTWTFGKLPLNPKGWIIKNTLNGIIYYWFILWNAYAAHNTSLNVSWLNIPSYSAVFASLGCDYSPTIHTKDCIISQPVAQGVTPGLPANKHSVFISFLWIDLTVAI
jgi:hypothetical protein